MSDDILFINSIFIIIILEKIFLLEIPLWQQVKGKLIRGERVLSKGVQVQMLSQ